MEIQLCHEKRVKKQNWNLFEKEIDCGEVMTQNKSHCATIWGEKCRLRFAFNRVKKMNVSFRHDSTSQSRM